MKKITLLIFSLIFSFLTYSQEEIQDNLIIKASPENGIEAFKLDFARALTIPTEKIIDINQKYLKIITSFKVDENGKISNVKVINDKHNLNSEISKTFEKLPNWIPAQENGVNISSLYTLPLILNINLPDYERDIFTIEKRRELEAKYQAFYYEFNKHMIYPRDFWNRYYYKNGPYEMGEKNTSSEFKYVIEFVINEEGNYEDIETFVNNKKDEHLNKAVKKSLAKCTPWEPAIVNGVKIKSKKRLPITINIK